MRLSRHFTLAEFIASNEATRSGISNQPTKLEIEKLAIVAKEFDKIRDALGVPVVLTSGFRSRALNRAVKGSKDSWHCHAQAGDIIAPRFGTPLELCQFIDKLAQAGEIRVHELIHEYGNWCHLAVPVSADEAADDERHTYDWFNGKRRRRTGLLEVA